MDRLIDWLGLVLAVLLLAVFVAMWINGVPVPHFVACVVAFGNLLFFVRVLRSPA